MPGQKVERAGGARKREVTQVPSDPLATMIRSAVRAELLELADQGLLGGQAVPRLAWSLAEFGRSIGRCEATIRGFVKLGMPHFRLGASLRVVPAEALAWLRENGDHLAEDE